MPVNIGINGFGRIGRIVTRIVSEDTGHFKLCGINLRKADLEYMAYMCKYDSVFGGFEGKIEADGDGLNINGTHIPVFSSDTPEGIDWAGCGAEYIIESTGAFLTEESCMGHIAAGAKKVLVTAPAKDASIPAFVVGVNDRMYRPDMTVVSGASCTTNCLAPLAKVLDESFGIKKALMTTIHAATAKQKAVDSRSNKDWRAGRSILGNIIPATTGAAKACALVLPQLKGKITGMAFRVPTNDVSVVDLTAELVHPASYAEICAAVRNASETYMEGVIAYTSDAVVSSDLKGEAHTCIFDEQAGMALDDGFVKLVAWYDNEWGYSTKMTELVYKMACADASAALSA